MADTSFFHSMKETLSQAVLEYSGIMMGAFIEFHRSLDLQFVRWLHSLGMHHVPSSTLFYLAYTLIMLFFVLLFQQFVEVWARLFRKATPVALLIGPCNAGKTALFVQLRARRTVETHTSMKENECTIELDDSWPSTGRGFRARAIHLVDLPGHPRLREHVRHYLSIARVVVFVVSGVARQDYGSEAEFLYWILSNPAFQSRKLSLLVLVNKDDLITARSVDHVRQQLEVEMNKQCLSKSLLPEEDEDEIPTYLVPKDEDFTFEGLPFPVVWESSSAIGSTPHLDGLRRYLASVR